MSIIRSKRSRVIIGVIAALALAGAAVAYWTTSGTGQGTATVGTDSGVSIGGLAFASTLYPGGSTSVSFTITNLSASTAVTVDKVVTDTSFGGGTGITGLPVGCLAADFTFADVNGPWSIPASGSTTQSGTLSFANTAVSQDACKNASPVLHLKTA